MVESKIDLRIQEDRPLSSKETELVRWALEHGLRGSHSYLPQVDKLRVISRCGCGCASVDFSFDGVLPDYSVGLEVLSDHLWGTGGMDLCGVFVFDETKNWPVLRFGQWMGKSLQPNCLSLKI